MQVIQKAFHQTRRAGRVLRRAYYHCAGMIWRVRQQLIYNEGPSWLPEQVSAQLGNKIKRVILVANNQNMEPLSVLNDAARNDDLIVQFNMCMHSASFLESNCAKLFVFRSIEDFGTNFGFSPTTNAFTDISPEHLHGEISILFINNLPDTVGAPEPLRTIIDNPQAVTLLTTTAAPFKYYPRPKEVPFSGPSTGFVVLQLFLEWRQQLLRKGQSDFEIVLLGFNNTSNDYLWQGHNWRFEREFVHANSHQLTLFECHEAGMKIGAC